MLSGIQFQTNLGGKGGVLNKTDAVLVGDSSCLKDTWGSLPSFLYFYKCLKFTIKKTCKIKRQKNQDNNSIWETELWMISSHSIFCIFYIFCISFITENMN